MTINPNATRFRRPVGPMTAAKARLEKQTDALEAFMKPDRLYTGTELVDALQRAGVACGGERGLGVVFVAIRKRGGCIKRCENIPLDCGYAKTWTRIE